MQKKKLLSCCAVISLTAGMAQSAQAQTLFDVIDDVLSLEGDVLEINDSLIDLSVDVDDIQTDVLDNADAILDLDVDLNTLNGDVSLIEGDLALLEGDVSLIEGDLALLEGDVSLLEDGLTLIEGDVLDNANAILDLDTDLSVLEGGLSILEGDVLANADSILDLADDITLIEGDVLDNADAILDLDADLTLIEGDVLDNANAIVDLEIDVDALENVVSDNSDRIDQNTIDIADNTTRIDQLDIDVDALEVDVAQNTAQIEVNTDAIAANNARDDEQDVLIADNSQRNDEQDVLIADNTARNDAQDISIAQNTVLANEALDTGRAALTATTVLRDDVDAGRIGVVQVVADEVIAVGGDRGGTVVTFGGTDGDRRLSGIADGTAANDAATVGQVARGDAAVLASAMDYTDQSLAGMMGELDRVFVTLSQSNRRLERELDRVGAGSAAIAGLPQAFIPGKGMVAMSFGGRGDQTALAVGVGKAFEGQYTPVVRAGLAFDLGGGSATYNVAAGIHF